MDCYTAYGLTIQSALRLPELAPAEKAPDVVVCWGTVARQPPLLVRGGWSLWADPRETRLFCAQGAVGVCHGREIVLEPGPDAEEPFLRFLVLGPALALLLHQRDHLVLHANAVSVKGRGAAFLGHSGQGKSTLTAALYERGHRLVADDITAVSFPDAAAAVVHPSFPQIKLCPDALTFLGQEPEALPRLYYDSDKRTHHAARGFSPASLPLRRCYVLAEGPGPQIVPLRPAEAFLELKRHSYPAVAGSLPYTGANASHFRRCALLTRAVPVYRLSRPRSLEALPDLAQLVEDDLARTSC